MQPASEAFNPDVYLGLVHGVRLATCPTYPNFDPNNHSTLRRSSDLPRLCATSSIVGLLLCTCGWCKPASKQFDLNVCLGLVHGVRRALACKVQCSALTIRPFNQHAPRACCAQIAAPQGFWIALGLELGLVQPASEAFDPDVYLGLVHGVRRVPFAACDALTQGRAHTHAQTRSPQGQPG